MDGDATGRMVRERAELLEWARDANDELFSAMQSTNEILAAHYVQADILTHASNAAAAIMESIKELNATRTAIGKYGEEERSDGTK